MKLLVLSLAFPLLVASQTFGQNPEALTWGIEDGNIALRSDVSYRLFGADFTSEGGYLVPIDPPDADPFVFFLSNTPESIVFASVPIEATVPAYWDTGIGYSGPVSEIEGDVLISMGDGSSHPRAVAFTYCDRPGLPVDCVPEPSTGILLCVTFLGLGWMRNGGPTRKRNQA